MQEQDIRYLNMAAALGRRNLGNTGSNPSVGCVLVKNGKVIARGITGDSGKPHAETVALERASKEAKGATAYVTLEPCAHHGKTPPCAEALVKAGIARVVYSISDPDPRVNGAGEKLLRDAGIAVERIHTDEAAALHAGFLTRITQKRPYITLKMAVSKDGFIAGKGGKRTQISNPASHRYAHLLRAEADAILVGVNTVIQDDPELTCRLPGLENRSPQAVVIDASGRLPKTAKLLQKPLWIFTQNAAAHTQASENTQIFYTENLQSDKVSINEVCRILGENGINHLLVEGGKEIAESFLTANLIDEIAWIESPLTLGEGVKAPSLETLGLDHVFRIQRTADLEGDRLLILRKPTRAGCK